jgi:acyl-coenzyme A thioesterase PaaI-like protein
MANLFQAALLQNPGIVRFVMNRYAPLRGAGIRIVKIDADFKRVVVELPLTKKNRNIMGTAFGGSLYAMADPFFMLMLMRLLGKQHHVWDQQATIDFIAPGKGRVTGTYAISEEQLNSIIEQAKSGDKVLYTFHANIVHDDGSIVAKVSKVLYVKLKKEFRAQAPKASNP